MEIFPLMTVFSPLDFKQFSVCFAQVSRQWKQFLDLMLTRPLLKIEKLNPALFKFVVELREVKVR